MPITVPFITPKLISTQSRIDINVKIPKQANTRYYVIAKNQSKSPKTTEPHITYQINTKNLDSVDLYVFNEKNANIEQHDSVLILFPNN